MVCHGTVVTVTRWTRRLARTLGIRWARRPSGSLLGSPRLLVVVLLCAGLLWPLPQDGRVAGHLAWAVASEWAACVTTGSPPPPAWRRAVREGVDDQGIDSDRIAARLGEDVPAHARLVSPRQVSRPDPGDDLLWPDRERQHPRTVIVAVIDSGVAADHPEVGVVKPGLDLVAPCGYGHTDATGHGTAVAGVIASQSHGAAPFVQVLPVRISLPDGHHAAFQSAAAIAWAVHRGADLINASYTNQTRGSSWWEHAAIRWARQRGVGVIAAAGNDPSRPVGFPAAYPEVLAVGSLDPDGDLSAFSARRPRPNGQGLDVVAPGARIVTLSPQGHFHVASGTSLATPVVTATAASLLLQEERLSGLQAVERLRRYSGGPVSQFQELTPR